MKTSIIIQCLLLISLIGNVLLSVYFFTSNATKHSFQPSNMIGTNADTEYPFLSRRIFIEEGNDIFVSFMPLRQAIREYIEKQTDTISVYFEYLPSGSSIGVNDSDEIQMASLLKVPIVMAIYRKIEKGELTKDKMLTAEKADLDNKYGTFWKNGVGATISVEDAIKKTLIESDNTTQQMLYRLLTPEDELRLHNELDARMEKVEGKTVPYISAKSYSSFLRSLYLSSFLQREHSDEMLSILSQSAFNDGIEAGVDPSTLVAHKTGNIDVEGKQTVSNDCGIVYIPKRPYILCIFVTTKDKETEALQHISSLSRMVFGYVNKVNTR